MNEFMFDDDEKEGLPSEKTPYEEGVSAGIAQGLDIGIGIGKERGIDEGIGLALSVLRMKSEGKDVQEIMKELHIAEERVRRILDFS